MLTVSKNTMISAYGNISFSPEKRGEQDYNYYSELLASDLVSLGDNKGNYEKKFNDRLAIYYARKSRTASAMICGPARFPFSKNLKAIDLENRAWEDFSKWREKYFRLVNRVRTKSPEQEIDDTLIEIEKLEARKALYQAFNNLKTFEEKEAYAKENGFYDTFTALWSKYDLVPKYHLTSMTTKIRERKKKLEVMRSRIDRKETFEAIQIQGGSIYLDNDRVIVKHDEKPSREVIDLIKSSGFKYSPKTSTWVRKHTENAIYSAKKLAEKLKG